MPMGETLDLVQSVLSLRMTGTSPTVRIEGGVGLGAAAKAIIEDGVITRYIITAGGTGYDQNDPPMVDFVNGGGSGAIATPKISNGRIIRIISDPVGSGYAYENTRYVNEPFYIKRWYINDPIRYSYGDLPFAVIKPSNENLTTLYAQEDTEIDTVVVTFFPTPITRVERYQLPAGTSADLIDRASRIIRSDPTFRLEGHPRVFSAQITSSVFKQVGFTGNETAHVAELHLEVKQRSQWRFVPDEGLELEE